MDKIGFWTVICEVCDSQTLVSYLPGSQVLLNSYNYNLLVSLAYIATYLHPSLSGLHFATSEALKPL